MIHSSKLGALWVCLFLSIVPQSILAQRFSSFSNDVSLTQEEMRTFANTVPKDRQKEAEKIIAEFDALWTHPAMGEKEQSYFIDISNQMLRKNLRFFPHFATYIQAYHAFINSDLSDNSRTWVRFLQYHINNDIGRFQQIMTAYANTFSNNILLDNGNIHWTVYGNDRSMGIDSVPYFEFVDVDLVGTSSRDSIQIIGTQGRYYPASSHWKGGVGTVYWERAGLNPNVKATFESYSVDIRQPRVHIENVLLHYPDFFKQPVLGVLDDKTGLETSEDKVTYPRFRSYDDNLTVPNIFKNVDYIGGFELRGASIQGYAAKNSMAKLVIRKDEKRVVTTQAAHFLFKNETVRAEDARVNVYIKNDSIYHPAANFYYNETNQQLLITRPKYGVGRSPFFDSYHKMDISVECLAWTVNTNRIEFKPMAGSVNQSVATFESQNFFNNSVMRQLQGANDVNPLYTLWQLFKSVDFRNVSFEEVVHYFNHSPEDVRALLIQFSAYGFIEYDVNHNSIIYRKKIAQYLNNDVRRKDFDNILLESKTHYAVLNLLNNELTVSGCEFFVLSDAQIVNVYPTNEEVTVKEGRDMIFSGRIIAGLFDFISHRCQFDYDDFKVMMDNIDSIIMYVEDKNTSQNMYGEHHLRKIQSSIEDLAGTLYIDMPHNKSGKIDNPKYPYFSSSEGGHVYYDHPFTFNRHYDRTKFYYELDLFTITNLDNYKIDSMLFKGQLISGGIFPNIRKELKVRPDFSLGFIYHTDQSSLPMYGGKGRFTDVIDLSNRGLRGKGTIDYLTSTTQSDSLIFFLDATTGSVRTHIVREQVSGVEFPPASVVDGLLRWEPYHEQMFVYTKSSPMSIFNETKLTGNSKLTPDGMFGTGTLQFNRADITSQLFKFKHHELFSDAANLRIYDLYQTNDIVFTTDNYNSHIDFKTRKGHFVSNGESSEVLFARNEFKTNASVFDWDPIDKDILIFKWDDPYQQVDINNTPAKELIDMVSIGNELISTSPKKRGLQWTATAAEFNFKDNVINCHGTRFINVGDAAIIPHDGNVIIREYADVDLLNKARIVAARDNKFHELYHCQVKIEHASAFSGHGDYDYVDQNKNVQVLHFDTLWHYQTIKGVAQIPFNRDFKLSPHFGFDGRAELNSANQFLTFVGGVELIHDCDTVKYARMRIHDQIDPEHVLIKVDDKTKDVQDRKVVVAIASTNTTGRIYTCFGAAKDQFNDSEYISAQGYIDFDEENQQFRAASLEKLSDPELPGNIITLNKAECISRGSGTIDMGAKLGRVDFQTLGTVVNYMKADSAEMSLTTSINFFFNEQSMKIMGKHIEESSLDFIDAWDNDDYEIALRTILNDKEYNDYAHEVLTSGQAKKLPEKLKVKFLFSNISFTWNKEGKAFVSQNMLPVVICNAKEINREIPGAIVIEKRGSRNRLYLYFEMDKTFFFFQLENNSMYGYSSDVKFNDAIVATKAEKRMLKPEDGKPAYTYKIGSRSQKNKFVKKFYVAPEKEEDE